MKAENLDSISIDEIHVSANLGTTIERAVEDAMILSIQEQVIVKVKHNAKTYIVNHKSMRDSVASTEII